MTLNKLYYFEIFKAHPKTVNGEIIGYPYYYSRIKSNNRKIIWTSETYTTKQNCEIPVLKLINIIGKKNCTLIFCDRVRKINSEVKL